jgi:hypothetical protein
MLLIRYIECLALCWILHFSLTSVLNYPPAIATQHGNPKRRLRRESVGRGKKKRKEKKRKEKEKKRMCGVGLWVNSWLRSRR